ncbi:MAG: hypothetical protein JXR88_04600 [Clostridia bacterium]|nr:hypothetical protein [Clostridia bacterium]
MINYRRARTTDQHIYLNPEYVTRQTALVAEREGKILGLLQYHFLSQMEIEIITWVNESSIPSLELLNEFINELTYWHPYLKLISVSKDAWKMHEEVFLEKNFKDQKYPIKNHTVLHEVTLDEITPEQLSVDQRKVEACLKWINRPEDVIVSCVIMNQELVCIDGYSRLIAAYEKALPHVYVHIEKIEDLSFYTTCLNWCKSEGINSISDLVSKVVSTEEHQRIWIDRCQSHLKTLKMNQSLGPITL